MTMSLVGQSHTTMGRVSDVPDIPEPRRRSYTGSSSDSCSPPSSEASAFSDTYNHDIIDGYRANMMTSGPLKPSSRVPALPDKSARRASRFLDVVPNSRPDSKNRNVSSATPYDVYLSSEEDASSSADDFSDFEFESEGEEHQKAHHGRTMAITARVVSVIFSGKPSIVELPARSRSSGSSEALTIKSVETESTLARRLSTASSTSSVTMFHPPRSSSRLPASIERSHRPAFLNTDPFPTKMGEEIDRPVTPLTPSAMLKRGLSLVKKRSRHQLSPAGLYSNSKENFSVQTLPVDPSEDRQSRQLMEDSPVETKSPGYYQEIMRTARRKARGLQESDAASITSNNTANLSKLRAGFSLGRRRSIKT